MGYIAMALYMMAAGIVTVGAYELAPKHFRNEIMDYIQRIGG